jgi:hypothetical protein
MQGRVDHIMLSAIGRPCCFPSAVRVQVRELGIDLRRPPTLTGGMAFAGGPLNNFVFQALVTMARVLRADPGSVGLPTPPAPRPSLRTLCSIRVTAPYAPLRSATWMMVVERFARAPTRDCWRR